MGVSTPGGDYEATEGLPVNSIPDELTDGFMLVISKFENGKDINKPMLGSLQNGSIQVGKPIALGMGHCTEVVSITEQNGVYLIRTQSGSEYQFDPSQSFETPDY